MDENYILNVIGCSSEINLSGKDIENLKVEVCSKSISEYNLYLGFHKTHRIFWYRFRVKNVLDDDSLQEIENVTWRCLQLPFCINDFILSNGELWVVRNEHCYKIEKHLYQKPAENLDEDEIMEVDIEEDLSKFECDIKLPVKDYQGYKNTFCVKSYFSNEKVVVCEKLDVRSCWQVYTTKRYSSSPNEFKLMPLCDFPIMYNESALVNQNLEDESLSSKPIIIFLSKNEFRDETNGMYQRLMDTFMDKSSEKHTTDFVSIIGHPEGKILYNFLSSKATSDNHKGSQLTQKMFDIKQPVAGVHILKNVEGITATTHLLIVGSLGKLVVISANKYFTNSESFLVNNVEFHATMLNLAESIQSHAVLGNCILYTSSEKDLWRAEFSICPEQNAATNELCVLRKSLGMREISRLALLNESKSLILLVTSGGTLYVSSYQKQSQLDQEMSLPTLMNEIMHQSTVLHNLALTANHQKDFFTALSTFASLKFGGAQFKVDCSIILANDVLKTYRITIGITNLNISNADFWFVHTSLCSHYVDNSATITKTVPFCSDQIILEVEASVLCPSFVSPFPLYLEVGLLLVLPDTLKTQDCFKLIETELPLYVKLQTFMLNELNFITAQSSRNRGPCQPNTSNVLAKIYSSSLKRPVAGMFHIKDEAPFQFLQQFTFHLLSSSVQNMVKYNADSETTLSGKLFTLLTEKSNLQHNPGSISCNGQGITLHVTDNGSSICITLQAKPFTLLVGLRMSIMEKLIKSQVPMGSQNSTCISIPTHFAKKCEKLNEDIKSIYGQNVQNSEVFSSIQSLYCQLRKEVSDALPIS